jgi:polyhydroxyalkanoate synthesis regulator phasin
MRDPLYDKLVLLDRLEDLLEEMEELGVTDIVQLTAMIDELEREIDDLEGQPDDER